MQGLRSVPVAIFCVVGFAAHGFSQSLTPPQFEVLRTFDSPPVRPLGGLTEGPGGFYGASQGGHFGRGTIFRLVPPTTASSASIEKVYSFTDADFAAGRGGALITPLLASDGHFYGVGSRANSNQGGGWIFRVTATGERTILHELTFQEGIALDYPFYGQGPLVEVAGWLYGTLYSGGPGNRGTVFRIGRTDGAFQLLHGFSGPDGDRPAGGLVERSGWLYGTTIVGGTHGAGTLFRISPDGTAFETLHHFTNATEGSQPLSELVLGPDGLLYGGLRAGGPAAAFGCGSIFRFDPDSSGPGALTLLVSFVCNSTQGTNPEGGMVIVESGDGSHALFGVTNGSGNSGARTIYRLSLGVVPAFTVLDTVPNDETCSARLLRASDGHIYGQCFGRNGSDVGRVFRVDPSTGSVSTIFRFGVEEGGRTPYALIEGRDGQLYGTTRKGGGTNRGTVFRISRDGEFETLHAFTDETTRYDPSAPGSRNPTESAATFLTHASDGLLYGTRCDGGDNHEGSVFSLDLLFGTYQMLYSARPGDKTACPHGPLLESPTSPGTFFGTATGGTYYNGGAFEFISSTSEVTPRWASPAGGLPFYSSPVGRLVIGPDGLLYAAYTEYSYSFFSYLAGGVFQARTDGGILRRNSFFFGSPWAPVSGLVQGPSTPTGGFVLYGSSAAGGSANRGSVYKVSVGGPAGSFTVGVLRSFAGGTDGAGPMAELTRGPDGLYYGTTAIGGQYGYGTLFAMGANEQVVTIHHFDYAAGAFPETELLAGSDGNLYGAAPSGGPGGGGLLFRINLAPTVEVEGPTAANEGDALTLTATGADPQGGALAFAWDLDADGAFDDATGATVLFTAPDGDHDYAVAVRATDPTGLVAEAGTTITVANVAPSVSIEPSVLAIDPGQTGALTVTFEDPGPDTWTATIDYGDGTGETRALSSPGGFGLSHTYTTPGSYRVIVTVSDDDGASGEAQAQVNVGTPTTTIGWLIGQVQSLIDDGTLNNGQGRSLIGKLELALERLEAGKTQEAVSMLEAFVHEVSAFKNAGILDPQVADQWIAITQAVIDSILG